MYARAVEEAGAHLRELWHEEWEDLGLGGLALSLAVTAAYVRPTLALPLFLGGLAVGARGMRAAWRRWDLVDRLAGERDAHAIPEVRAYAARSASMASRRALAARLRGRLAEPIEARVAPAAAELQALASELDDEELVLEPVCAVACARLLSDVTESPLLNPARPPEDLRSRVTQIRSGFEPRRFAA